MFTGIVQGMGTVTRLERTEGALSLTIDLGELVKDVVHGASVSVSGACLTVVEIDGFRIRFDAIGETLAKTTLGSLKIGDRVNIERAAKIGDEIGGHLVSGHVSGVVTIKHVETPPGNWIVTFTCDTAWMPYIFPKGFISLDGCSLTIVDVMTDAFTVHLIPETLSRTTFGIKKAGDRVNMEIDPMTQAIVETVRRMNVKL